MEIVLIRHAQPAWSSEGLADSNPGLTSLGLRQASRLRTPAVAWAAGIEESPSVLMASTMERARLTAIPVAEGSGLPVVPCEWLEEIRPPDHWHRQPTEYVEGVFAGAMLRAPEEWWEGFDGGESFRLFHERVTNGFLSTLAELGLRKSSAHEQLWNLPDHGPDRLVVVAHAGTNAVLLGLLLGLQTVPWEWERFSLTHASITRLSSTTIGADHTFSLRSFSETNHLQPDEISA